MLLLAVEEEPRDIDHKSSKLVADGFCVGFDATGEVTFERGGGEVGVIVGIRGACGAIIGGGDAIIGGGEAIIGGRIVLCIGFCIGTAGGDM